MKRLLRRANLSQAFEQYNSIIRELMSNDHNATWDEIYDEMVDEYGETNALEKSIDVVKDSLEESMNDIDPVGDVDIYEFYKEQLDRVNSIIL